MDSQEFGVLVATMVKQGAGYSYGPYNPDPRGKPNSMVLERARQQQRLTDIDAQNAEPPPTTPTAAPAAAPAAASAFQSLPGETGLAYWSRMEANKPKASPQSKFRPRRPPMAGGRSAYTGGAPRPPAPDVSPAAPASPSTPVAATPRPTPAAAGAAAAAAAAQGGPVGDRPEGMLTYQQDKWRQNSRNPEWRARAIAWMQAHPNTPRELAADISRGRAGPPQFTAAQPASEVRSLIDAQTPTAAPAPPQQGMSAQMPTPPPPELDRSQYTPAPAVNLAQMGTSQTPPTPGTPPPIPTAPSPPPTPPAALPAGQVPAAAPAPAPPTPPKPPVAKMSAARKFGAKVANFMGLFNRKPVAPQLSAQEQMAEDDRLDAEQDTLSESLWASPTNEAETRQWLDRWMQTGYTDHRGAQEPPDWEDVDDTMPWGEDANPRGFTDDLHWRLGNKAPSGEREAAIQELLGMVNFNKSSAQQFGAAAAQQAPAAPAAPAVPTAPAPAKPTAGTIAPSRPGRSKAEINRQFARTPKPAPRRSTTILA